MGNSYQHWNAISRNVAITANQLSDADVNSSQCVDRPLDLRCLYLLQESSIPSTYLGVNVRTCSYHGPRE